MEIAGEYRIAAPRAKVWDALNDPEILRQCIPGCKSLEQTSPDSLRATVIAQLGPVRANLQGTVDLSDRDPPAGYKLSWQGNGGATGFARGSAEVQLDDAGKETILRYKALCTVGGKLAQIGSRLIDSTAKKLSDEFFAKFAHILGSGDAQEATPEVVAHQAPAPSARAAYDYRLLLIAGVVAAVLIYAVLRSL